jgi:hypothetical protein
MLTEFYAVTATSVYRVFVNPLLDTQAIAQKVATGGYSAIALNEIIDGGPLIGVTRYGLVAYADPDGGRCPPEQAQRRHIGGWSSHVTGLFLDVAEAQHCISQPDRQPADARWQTQTQAVLAAIGPDHPCFVLSHSEALRFIY